MQESERVKTAVQRTQAAFWCNYSGNYEVSMPGKSVRVNKVEVSREHVTYGESNGGQSGKLTA